MAEANQTVLNVLNPLNSKIGTGGVASPEVLKVLEWFKSQLGKADQVVEEWHEGANFYRKYSSGFIEQGGIVVGNEVVKVTFGVPFTSGSYGSGYVVVALAEYATVGITPAEKAVVMAYSKTPTSVDLHGYAHGPDVRINWHAFGY